MRASSRTSRSSSTSRSCRPGERSGRAHRGVLREDAPHLPAAGFERGEGRLVAHDRVAVPRGEVEDVAPVFGVGRVVELVVDAAARKEVELRGEEVERDAVRIAPDRAVRVEPGGRGVDDRHRRQDAHLHAPLLRKLRHGFKAPPVRRDAERAVVRLFAARNGRRRRSGVRNHRIRRARARGTLVGQRVHRERPRPRRAAELLRDHALRRGHPVADEEEHVLRRRRARRDGNGHQAQKQTELHSCILLHSHVETRNPRCLRGFACQWRWEAELNRCTWICSPLPNRSAIPPESKGLTWPSSPREAAHSHAWRMPCGGFSWHAV